MPFTTQFRVRFEHCDPAGIIFYPRYYNLIHETIERWFDKDLGVSHEVLIAQRRLGIPTIHIETDFLAGSKLGDELQFELTLEAVGRSSFNLAIAAHCDGEPRLLNRQKLVFVALDNEPLKSVPIPADIKLAMEAALVTR